MGWSYSGCFSKLGDGIYESALDAEFLYWILDRACYGKEQKENLQYFGDSRDCTDSLHMQFRMESICG